MNSGEPGKPGSFVAGKSGATEMLAHAAIAVDPRLNEFQPDVRHCLVSFSISASHGLFASVGLLVEVEGDAIAGRDTAHMPAAALRLRDRAADAGLAP